MDPFLHVGQSVKFDLISIERVLLNVVVFPTWFVAKKNMISSDFLSITTNSFKSTNSVI